MADICLLITFLLMEANSSNEMSWRLYTAVDII